MVPFFFFPQRCFHSFSIHSSVSCTARPPPSILQRTTIQCISISSKKENLTEEQRNHAEPPPPPIRHLPSTPASSPPVPSPVSPPSQPSLLASLLARKRSIVTVPATKEVSPPSRGSSCLSPDRLPYLPHSPFHLFSYDLDEEPSKSGGESPKETSPRSDGLNSSKPRSSARFSWLFVFTFHLFHCTFPGSSTDPLPSPASRHLSSSHLFFSVL